MEGFMSPFDFGSASFMPQMPDVAAGGGIFGGAPAMGAGGQPDLPSMAAASLGMQGIRPDQFLRDPSLLQATAPATLPSLGTSLMPGGPNTSTGAWDATPVSSPGGPEVKPTGAPLDIRSDAQKSQDASSGGDAMAAGGKADKQGDMAKKITDTLRAVTMPKPPAPQTIRTPAPAAPHAPQAVKSGQLLALLQALGAGGGAPTHSGPIPMPLAFR